MNLPRPLTPFLLLVSASLGTLLAAAPARAIDFTGYGGLNYAAPTQRVGGAENHWTGDAGFSFGATIGIPIFLLPFEFETGFFLINENSSRDDLGIAYARKNKMFQVPFVVRFNLDDHIGIGAGGYVSFGQGNVETVANGVSTFSSYETAGEASTDAGLIANVRARFNLAPPFYFILDARYQHGLSDRALLPNDLYNTRSIQVFAGVQFALLSSHDDSEE